MSEQSLTAEQIDDLRRMLAERAAGVSPYPDAIDDFVSDNSEALIAMALRLADAESAVLDAHALFNADVCEYDDIRNWHQNHAEVIEALKAQEPTNG